MSRIIYTNSDGTVSILQPILTEINPNTGKPFTIEEIAEKDVPVGISTYSIVEDSVIPTDRSFRDSWVGNGVGVSTATIVEDLTKAKEIHKTNIRNARIPKLAELDVEFTKALETGASTTDIVAEGFPITPCELSESIRIQIESLPGELCPVVASQVYG